MKSPYLTATCLLTLIACAGLASALVGGSCPLCSSHEMKYCNISITEPRLYNHEVTINVTEIFKGVATPIEERSDLEIWYYNESGEIEKLKFKTDKTGVIRFTPSMVGYHLIKVCGKAVLVFVNTTCGDAVCGGSENRLNCPTDCGKCGDGVCDSNENLSCRDCAACGDHVCSLGESRNTCLKDCVMCGDGICDYIENRSSCPADCASGRADGCCDAEVDGLCDPDCEMDNGTCADPDCMPKVAVQNTTNAGGMSKGGDTSGQTIVFGATIAILAAVVVIYAALTLRKPQGQKKKSTKKTEPVKEDIPGSP